VKEAERLTTKPGQDNFVLTLWPRGRADSPTLPVYLAIDSQQAEDLSSLLQGWLQNQRAATRRLDDSSSHAPRFDPIALPPALTFLSRAPLRSETKTAIDA
jgi:hypothetical protein